MAEIVWNRNVLSKNKKEIEKYLNTWLWLVPKWCQELHIALYPSSENGNNACETTSDYEYRRIKIDFFTGWINERDEAKRMHIVHELIHGFIAPMADYASHTFDILASEDNEPKLNQTVNDELRVRHESATQDLAFAIYKKFYKPE